MADKTKYFDYDTVKEMLYDLEYEGKEVEPSDYPYIEIADEHGRLIDANELIITLKKHASPSGREWYYAEVAQIIEDVTTVLEASNE